MGLFHYQKNLCLCDLYYSEAEHLGKKKKEWKILIAP